MQDVYRFGLLAVAVLFACGPDAALDRAGDAQPGASPDRGAEAGGGGPTPFFL
jgi:hypothetical protein